MSSPYLQKEKRKVHHTIKERAKNEKESTKIKPKKNKGQRKETHL